MGSKNRRKLRREVDQNAAAEIEGHKLVLRRCGESWSRAYQELREQEVKFLEFADPNFDCRECPLFMECLTRNHFSRRSWIFPWMDSDSES